MPNASVLEQKKAIVAELTEKLQNAASGVLVDYKGITVAEDTALRNELRKNNVEYAVVKNTLTRFAAQNAGLGDLSDSLNGTTSLAISHEDPIAPHARHQQVRQAVQRRQVRHQGRLHGRQDPSPG